MSQESITDLYKKCTLCPNGCKVDRTQFQRGRCGQTDRVKIAWSGLHRGEEPPISGRNGSGMIFFCGCPLHCKYCQNYQISSADAAGIEITTDQLTQIMLALQDMGAASLNLVTGTHFVPSIISALENAKKNGLILPVVWNSSGFESVETLRLIDRYIDLYLLDIKTLDSEVAKKFCGLECYADVIIPVVNFLKRRHPSTDLKKPYGVLVRHLVFPGTEKSTLKFLTWFADNLKDCFRLSLMTQFVPPLENPGFERMSDSDYNMLCDKLDELGIDGFIQEREENEILWIPDFNKLQPFPEGFADTLPLFEKFRTDCNADFRSNFQN